MREGFLHHFRDFLNRIHSFTSTWSFATTRKFSLTIGGYQAKHWGTALCSILSELIRRRSSVLLFRRSYSTWYTTNKQTNLFIRALQKARSERCTLKTEPRGLVARLARAVGMTNIIHILAIDMNDQKLLIHSLNYWIVLTILTTNSHRQIMKTMDAITYWIGARFSQLIMRIYKLNTYQYSVFTKRKQPRYVTVESYSKVDVCKERGTNYICRWLINMLGRNNLFHLLYSQITQFY